MNTVGSCTVHTAAASAAVLAATLLVFALPVSAGRGLLAEAPAPALPTECPPPGFSALQNFSIAEYISAPWYIQSQVPLVYQPEDQLYCVRAKYEPLNEEDLLEGLLVKNYANEGRVNGDVRGTSTGGWFEPDLIATVPDKDQPAKLEVGFKVPFTTWQLLPGPYWVIAAGANNGSQPGTYDWAIVSGGEPTEKTEEGLCTTGSGFKVNGVGLWLFSRVPQDPQNTELMLQKLKDMGVDTSELLPVQQEGCLYEGAD